MAATSLTFGCVGTVVLDHLLVYWVGPILGALAALYAYKTEYIKSHLMGEAEADIDIFGKED